MFGRGGFRANSVRLISAVMLLILLSLLSSSLLLIPSVSAGTSEVKFTGTAERFESYAPVDGCDFWWVSVENVLSGPHPCASPISISFNCVMIPPTGAYVDPSVKAGDKVEVYAYYEHDPWEGCWAWLGESRHYIKRISGPAENQPPVADFTWRPLEPQAGETVHFSASRSYDRDGRIVNWSWTFGDGATGQGPSPTHVYSNRGTYLVCLRVTDNDGASDTACKEIRVGEPTEEKYSLFVRSNVDAFELYINGRYADTEDTYDSDKQIEIYDIPKGTRITIELRKTSYKPASRTVTVDRDGKVVYIPLEKERENQPPEACFTVWPDSPKVGEEITFDGGCSRDPDGRITSYSYDFGDGATATGEEVRHSFSSAQTYRVCLTVTDNDGATDRACKDITIGEELSLFLFEPEVDGYKVKVNGVVKGASGPPEWDWGDGSVEHSWFANTHTYSKAGTYTVRVIACNAAGRCITKTKTLTIRDTKPEPQEIKFRGTVIKYKPRKTGSGSWWVINVEKIISGPRPCTNSLHVWVGPHTSGHVDPNIEAGAKVEVYGKYVVKNKACVVGVQRQSYYIKIVSSGEELSLYLFDPEVDGYTVKLNGVQKGASGPPKWNWGDGTPEKHHYFPNTHSYDGPGTYTITVTACSASGRCISKSKTVTLRPEEDSDGDGIPDDQDRCPHEPGPRENNGCPLPKQRPVAKVSSPLPPLVLVGETVTLDASPSYDPDGQVVSYFFNFGDGETSGWVSGAVAKHSYPEVGLYEIHVKVKDNDGLESDWDSTDVGVGKDITFRGVVDGREEEEIFVKVTQSIQGPTPACSQVSVTRMEGNQQVNPNPSIARGDEVEAKGIYITIREECATLLMKPDPQHYIKEINGGSFTGSQFSCACTSDGRVRCSLDYNNQLGEKAQILFLLKRSASGEVVDDTVVEVDQGSGTAEAYLDCPAGESGTYQVSWKAYRKRDDIPFTDEACPQRWSCGDILADSTLRTAFLEYDANGDGEIVESEKNEAILDFLNPPPGDISKDEACAVIKFGDYSCKPVAWSKPDEEQQVGCPCGEPSEKPDLVAEDIYWRPVNPTEQDSLGLYIKLWNKGNKDADSFYVSLSVDGNLLTDRRIDGLPSGKRTTLIISEGSDDWSWKHDCGVSHTLKAFADAHHEISESNENNNEVSKSIRVECVEPSGSFTATSFTARCLDTGPYANHIRVTLSYQNDLGEEALVVFLFKKASTGEVIGEARPYANEGSGQVGALFECPPGEPGTYRISWKAYRESDIQMTDPVAWSKPDEEQWVNCPCGDIEEVVIVEGTTDSNGEFSFTANGDNVKVEVTDENSSPVAGNHIRAIHTGQNIFAYTYDPDGEYFPGLNVKPLTSSQQNTDQHLVEAQVFPILLAIGVFAAGATLYELIDDPMSHWTEFRDDNLIEECKKGDLRSALGVASSVLGFAGQAANMTMGIFHFSKTIVQAAELSSSAMDILHLSDFAATATKLTDAFEFMDEEHTRCVLKTPEGEVVAGPYWDNLYPTARIEACGLTNDMNLCRLSPIKEATFTGLEVDFDAQFSEDTDDPGDLLFEWDFDDGTGSNKREVTHMYEEPGSYTVRLTVRDPDGAEDKATMNITIKEMEGELPVANFSYSRTNPMVGEQVYFDASEDSYDPDGYIKRYEWDFGGGYESTGSTSKHTFQDAGEHEVTLTVTDNDDLTATKTRIVEVQPEAQFGNIKVHVMDATCTEEISQAYVYLFVGGHDLEIFKKTDAEGWCEFKGSKWALSGSYPLRVQATGYEQQSTDVEVEPGETKTVEFCLNRETNQITFTSSSPVDLQVTDPDGLVVSKESSQIPDATYTEKDLNADGDPDDQIVIPNRKIGDYQVRVIPEPRAKTTDTYTLQVSAGGEVETLAEEQEIKDIPDEPYKFTSKEIVLSIEEAIDENDNGIIDDPEILNAVEYWIKGEEVPGTGGQTISDEKILELIQLWISGRSISSSAQAGASQIGSVGSLNVREIKLFPNPMGDTSTATFKAEGSGIAGIQVEIFNLAGVKVFEQRASGSSLEFHAMDDKGRPLANGVYLYLVTVRGFNEEVIRSEVRKLVILR